MGSHTGTHVDAYSHMHEGKETLDEIPIERFFGKAQVVGTHQDWTKKWDCFYRRDGNRKVNKIVDLNPGFVGGNITEDLERALLYRGIITYTRLINLELIPKGKIFMFMDYPKY